MKIIKPYRMLGTVLVLSLLLTGGSLNAQKRKKTGPCANPKTQGEMNQCAADDYQAADAALNQVYQKLTSLLDEGEKAELKEAESAWIKYRDAHCRFVSDEYKGGTAEPMVYDGCLTDVTKNRTTELRAQIKERRL